MEKTHKCRVCGGMFSPHKKQGSTCNACREITYFRKREIRDRHNERIREYRKRPEIGQRMRARERVHHEIRQGRIVRQPCEVCGAPKTQAHHADYSKPLEVRWLCHEHHRELHNRV
jgi:hypothetical protein